MTQTLKIPLKSKTAEGSQRQEREGGGGIAVGIKETLGGVREVRKGIEAMRTASLSPDIKGKAHFFGSVGLEKQSGKRRHLGWAERKDSKKQQGYLSEELQSGGLLELQVDGCGKEKMRDILRKKCYSEGVRVKVMQ